MPVRFALLKSTRSASLRDVSRLTGIDLLLLAFGKA
jgi:hypothetical protein